MELNKEELDIINRAFERMPFFDDEERLQETIDLLREKFKTGMDALFDTKGNSAENMRLDLEAKEYADKIPSEPELFDKDGNPIQTASRESAREVWKVCSSFERYRKVFSQSTKFDNDTAETILADFRVAWHYLTPENKKRMRAVIQRVSHASVTIDGQVKSSIGQGFLILLGICDEDTMEDVGWLVKKVAGLRVFDDENHVMNLSIQDVNGEALVVSQFTLYASYKKGNRPSWFRAGSHEHAIPLYEAFCETLSSQLAKPVGTGAFGADMKVELLNDGPVTICIDTKNKE